MKKKNKYPDFDSVKNKVGELNDYVDNIEKQASVRNSGPSAFDFLRLFKNAIEQLHNMNTAVKS